ncbi:MAG: sigma-70 family RNA polymerase sigma factor [Solirubrobacteraceae bacterium MAG38_C4-C5]|nr:sigma-70 family RNA polymerase sigma factor [Candidatus Siliceabacter maunaloa]
MQAPGEKGTPISALAAPLAPPPATQRTDEELVASVRRGDDAAFGVLFERYRPRLIAFAAGMVGDHGRAEDVTQEVFISALRRLRATDAPIAFKPWIYEIARNACIDTFRRSRRTDEVSLDVEEGPVAGIVARLANTAPGPVTALDDKERLTDLRGAFGGLSDAERDALVLRELEGRSYREIGERLEMARPAVESTLFRARRKLEFEYGELRSGERCRRVQGIVVAMVAAGGEAGDVGEPVTRDARRLARHVSHCQPCRRAALAVGVAVDPAEGRPLRSRVAGLLPLPAFLRQEGGALASLAGHAEPALAWAKAVAAAATVTAVGLGAGVTVEEGAGVTLGAGGAQPLVETVSGEGPGEPWWAGDAQAAATGARVSAMAPAQGREGAALGAGREPAGLLTGGKLTPPLRPDSGDDAPPGGLAGSLLPRLFPQHPEARRELGHPMGSDPGGAPDPFGGKLRGDATGGPQASVPTASPTAIVQGASDTLHANATGASPLVAELPLPSHAPPLDASTRARSAQPLIELVTGEGPGGPWRPRGAQAAAAAIGSDGAAMAPPPQGRDGSGRDGAGRRAAPGDPALRAGPGDAGTAPAAPGPGNVAGRGGDGAGPLTGEGLAPAPTDSGGAAPTDLGGAGPTRLGGAAPTDGIEDPALDGVLFPPFASQPEGVPEVPRELGDATGSDGVGASDPGVRGTVTGGDVTGGPQQASVHAASPTVTVESASDTQQATATGAGAPVAELPSYAPAPDAPTS